MAIKPSLIPYSSIALVPVSPPSINFGPINVFTDFAVYANSLLATLNGRNLLRGLRHGPSSAGQNTFPLSDFSNNIGSTRAQVIRFKLPPTPNSSHVWLFLYECFSVKLYPSKLTPPPNIRKKKKVMYFHRRICSFCCYIIFTPAW